MPETETVLAETGSIKLVKKTGDDRVELRQIFYCIPGYGNREETIIEATPKETRIYIVRHNCGGTGVVMLHKIPCDLREELDKVNSLSDVGALIEKIETYEDRLTNEILIAIDRLIDELSKLEVGETLKELLKDKERVLEILEHYVIE